MELRVQLKICEGCGCLWYRAQSHCSSYCRECVILLRDFPVDTRRPRRTTHKQACPPLIRAWAVAETGGAK
jgi:hypothetical protein